MANKSKEIAEHLLAQAGIKINGSNPWDIQVHNENLYNRIFADGVLAVGESYMDGWWDVKALDQFFDRVFRTDFESILMHNWKMIFYALKTKLFNRQSKSRAFEVGKEHYDAGNDLYEAMLDKRMQYTCGYWKHAETLDNAQEDKLHLICQKIGLEPGMKVLEFGCGFGEFAKFAAENYGAEVTGYTVSKEQVKFGRQLCQGLPVDIKLEDYRNASGSYDRVVSVGIMEHIGFKNYRTYMELANSCLKDDGIAFIHTIGGNNSVTSCNPWSDKYIFPNGMIPSIKQLGEAMEGLFVMEDWHNFGEDYDRTLMAWYANFIKAWPKLKSEYSERFFRMWSFYLLSAAACFRCRDLQLWQIVMTKSNRTQPDCRISDVQKTAKKRIRN